MSDWQTDLNLKLRELNIQKEDKNVRHIISSNIIGSRNDNRSSRNVHKLSIHKEINNDKKKEELMITKEAALEDLEKIDVNAPVGKVIVEVGKVIVKVLATIRSNQLLTEEDRVRIKEIRVKRDTEKKL